VNFLKRLILIFLFIISISFCSFNVLAAEDTTLPAEASGKDAFMYSINGLQQICYVFSDSCKKYVYYYNSGYKLTFETACFMTEYRRTRNSVDIDYGAWSATSNVFNFNTHNSVYTTLYGVLDVNSNINNWLVQSFNLYSMDSTIYRNMTGGKKSTSNLSILLPRDGFKQSQINAVTMYISVSDIPVLGDNLGQIQVTGYREDREHEVEWLDTNKTDNDTYFSATLKVSGAVEFNQDIELVVTMTDYLSNIYTDSIHVYCYENFVDANGDGLDDRTGQDMWGGSTDYGVPNANGFPSGSLNPIDYLVWFGNQFSNMLTSISNMFKSFTGFGKQFMEFFGSIFSFLPPEFNALIFLGMCVVVLLRIIRR